MGCIDGRIDFLALLLVGVYKGAVRIAVSLVTTLLTLVIVFFASPFVAGLIEDKNSFGRGD